MLTQLVTDCVCLLLGVVEVEHSQFSELPAAARSEAMRAVRVNQKSKVGPGQLNNGLKLTNKLWEMEGVADYNNKSRCSYPFCDPFFILLSHCHLLSLMHLIYSPNLSLSSAPKTLSLL